jgi:rare lipoprotein A (peptidoglycan hydrolase)
MFKQIIQAGLILCGITGSVAFSQTDTSAVPPTRPPMEKPLSPETVRVKGKALTGMAGTYSSRADGTKTANGEIFDNKYFTAACNKFKFNTWLKVTNLKNHAMVLVRVNDRNSKKKTAPLLELSRSAVTVLRFLKSGSIKVKVEEVELSDSLQKVLNDSSVVPSMPLPSKSERRQIDTVVIGKAVTGIASFYSANLDGTKTATGERYRNAKLTAASNHFKLNTWVRVTNLRNQKTVVVRINDRMHPRMKKKGRVVDLSREAARILDFMDNGLVKVKVEPIAFKNADTANDQQRDSLRQAADTLAPVSVDSSNKVVVPEPVQKDSGLVVTGIASYYSARLEGTKTANGERYRNNKLSAASNEFALGTWVRITNLSNQKKVVLRINDRMHPSMQAKGRVADLSRAAAQKIGFINKGLTKVKMEPVKPGTLN